MKIFKINDETNGQAEAKKTRQILSAPRGKSTKLSAHDYHEKQHQHREKILQKHRSEQVFREDLANGILSNQEFVVTKVAPAAKTPGRYNVFINGDFSFSLDELQLLNCRLKKGDQLTAEQYLELKNNSDFGKNYVRALDLISRRPRSEKEIRDYGFRKKWLRENCEKVINRLREHGYLDDEKFAKSFVSARASLRNFSRRKMELELTKRGVSREIRDKVLAENSDFDEQQSLEKLVAKKWNHYEDDQRLIAYLARQGFDYDKIKQVIRDFKEDKENDA